MGTVHRKLPDGSPPPRSGGGRQPRTGRPATRSLGFFPRDYLTRRCAVTSTASRTGLPVQSPLQPLFPVRFALCALHLRKGHHRCVGCETERRLASPSSFRPAQGVRAAGGALGGGAARSGRRARARPGVGAHLQGRAAISSALMTNPTTRCRASLTARYGAEMECGDPSASSPCRWRWSGHDMNSRESSDPWFSTSLLPSRWPAAPTTFDFRAAPP